jgi:hypothetical protein
LFELTVSLGHAPDEADLDALFEPDAPTGDIAERLPEKADVAALEFIGGRFDGNSYRGGKRLEMPRPAALGWPLRPTRH